MRQVPGLAVDGRRVYRVLRGTPAKDGAGVALRRVFGHREAEDLDPFLLLDDFGSEDPDDYLPGFPLHPHRGIETVTYLLAGRVDHRDSLGNGGSIGPLDMQWMSAGSGILHEEMPRLSPGGVRGLQLWVNLARAEKMKAPAYRAASAAAVPAVRGEGFLVRVLAGSFRGRAGALSGIAGDPEYLDVELEAGAELALEAPRSRTAVCYLVSGVLANGYRAGDCLCYGRDADAVLLRAGDVPCRLVLACAEPLREPIAWGGPIVMNTEAEIETAFRELREGRFVES